MPILGFHPINSWAINAIAVNSGGPIDLASSVTGAATVSDSLSKLSSLGATAVIGSATLGIIEFENLVSLGANVTAQATISSSRLTYAFPEMAASIVGIASTSTNVGVLRSLETNVTCVATTSSIMYLRDDSGAIVIEVPDASDPSSIIVVNELTGTIPTITIVG